MRHLTAEPVLLDDRQMREFVTRGYLTFRLDLPEAFHRRVRERALEDIRRCEEAGIRSPLNNALPRIPELRRVFDHPRVAGALTSILGAGYYLHLHRHMHDNRPGSDAQTIHQDSLGNSRYAVDGNRRHHHCRWAMAFYYPQDTTLDMGPSAVAPCSQYLTEGAGLDAEQALEGPAGTVTIVHYDLFHRGLANRSGDTRLMIKFLFARMEEPVRPSWNAAQAAWPEEPGSDARDRQRVWRHHWRWFRGESAANGDGAAADVRALERDLDHADEWRGLAAAYGLGAAGAAGAPALLAALTGSDPVARRRAAYGFGPLGRAGVGGLTEAAGHDDAEVRARAVDVLGDVGRAAGDAVPALGARLRDESSDVRALAADCAGDRRTGQHRGRRGGRRPCRRGAHHGHGGRGRGRAAQRRAVAGPPGTRGGRRGAGAGAGPGRGGPLRARLRRAGAAPRRNAARHGRAAAPPGDRPLGPAAGRPGRRRRVNAV